MICTINHTTVNLRVRTIPHMIMWNITGWMFGQLFFVEIHLDLGYKFRCETKKYFQRENFGKYVPVAAK